jgi:hypothetical protein
MFFMRIISILHPRKYVAPLLLLVSLLASPSLMAQWVPLNPVTSVDPQPDGLVIDLQTGFLRFQVCSDSIVHVVYSLERNLPQRADYLVTRKSWPRADFSLHSDDPKLITLTTSKLKIEITRARSSP